MDSCKLTLFFNDNEGLPQLDDGMYRRDLDPETAPILDDDGNAMWVIGRGKTAHIAFDSLTISRHQAWLRCWAVESRHVWQIKHNLNATNPSYKDNRDGVIRLPDQWLNIHDYDVFWFAKPQYGFVCTSAPNDTMQVDDSVDDGPPTVNETMEKAISECSNKSVMPWYADFLHIVINGPRGFPQWLWWLCMLGAGMFVAWIRHRGD